jgi:hypothetical protein
MVAHIPVDWRCDTVLVAGLERVNHSEKFCSATPRRCWVGHDEADDLFGIDNEDRANRKCRAPRVHVAQVLVVNPIALG